MINSDITTSRLVSSILIELEDLGYPNTPNLVVWVSVDSKLRFESFDGRHIKVRWLCWSILNDRGEVRAPVYDVLSVDVTRAVLEAELPQIFPHAVVIVDDNIEME